MSKVASPLPLSRKRRQQQQQPAASSSSSLPVVMKSPPLTCPTVLVDPEPHSLIAPPDYHVAVGCPTSVKAQTADGYGDWRSAGRRPSASGGGGFASMMASCRARSPFVVVNVGGERHRLPWSALGRLPKARLGRIARCTAHDELLELCDDYTIFYRRRRRRPTQHDRGRPKTVVGAAATSAPSNGGGGTDEPRGCAAATDAAATATAWDGADTDDNDDAIELFFDRHPKSFIPIVNFYRTGKLHTIDEVIIAVFDYSRI